MRRIRIRLRVKRPEFSAAPLSDETVEQPDLPSRSFPEVSDRETLPDVSPRAGELPARQGPAPRVSSSISKAGSRRVEFEKTTDREVAVSVPYQPVLRSLGDPADTITSVEPLSLTDQVTGSEVAGCVCPACGATLSVRPHTKSTCGACSVVLHVRSGQRLFAGGLVPDSEVDAVDLMERLEPLGITWEQCAERLEKDAAGRPKEGALAVLLRNLCEERLPELLPGTQVRLLHEMARERQYRSEDPRPLLRRAQVILLQKMRDAGVDRVRVACHGFDACPACKEQAGRSVSIADALEQQLLPLADCRQADGFCRCRYTEADGASGPALDL
jgi:hypothetical protein